MDDFVREKLTQWGLKEYIEKFREEEIDSESLYCLDDSDVDMLFPKFGPKSRFRKRLEQLKAQQKGEETTDVNEVLPSTSVAQKRKLDPQCESSKGQQTVKRHSNTNSSTEARILDDAKDTMGSILTILNNQGDTNLNTFLKTKIKNLETEKNELVGVFGRTGAGKTSLINAVIGERNLLPSGSVTACTSVMIKVEANKANDKYEAEIEFISPEEWEDELSLMFSIIHKGQQENENTDDNDDDNQEYNDAVEKLSALYGKEWREKSCEQLMESKYFKEIQEFRLSTPKNLIFETAKDLSKDIVKYTRGETNNKIIQKWYWPLVKCVTIRVPKNQLLQHVTLVDLPGNEDRNKSRDMMWKGILGNCSVVWVVAEIGRAAAEKASLHILNHVSSQIGNGGECRYIHIICTKSDNIDTFDELSKAEVQDWIRKRNQEAKASVLKELDKLTKIKKHFSGENIQVFTVSSKEFFREESLSRELTEIPKLWDFLQNLNDRHSETLNYVSGAHSILSLIQGASIRKEVGRNEEVCEALEKNLSLQIESIGKEMETIYRDLEKCLQEGVEKSKNSCEKTMKSVLYPARRGGRGFHKQLKKAVENGGVWRPKIGEEINLNMKLTSCLTDSIDEKFRETFPNEGEVGPFNGAINKFSLGTKELKEKYKDVKLHLIFLESEEEFLKTDLQKSIRKDKKDVYRSLTESVEKAMEDCYKKAAVFTGTGTLQNMRDTIEKHVNASKNIMFENAKNVMMNQLHQLRVEVQQRLENTMKKSFELSLKTDEHSIPDVSAELQKVQKLYDELKKC